MLVSHYTIIRRDYEVNTNDVKKAVEYVTKNINDYDDETMEEMIKIDGKTYCD